MRSAARIRGSGFRCCRRRSRSAWRTFASRCVPGPSWDNGAISFSCATPKDVRARIVPPRSSAGDTRRTKGGGRIRSERTPLSSFRSNSGDSRWLGAVVEWAVSSGQPGSKETAARCAKPSRSSGSPPRRRARKYRATNSGVTNMNTFETSATVEDHGQVHLAGVPFAPGTEVEVTIREKVAGDANPSPATVEDSARPHERPVCPGAARNTEPVGPLRREELYDRKVLR